MFRPNGIITLSTDFSRTDAYIGIMKGVILGINPKATCVDLAQDLTAYDIDAGSFIFHTTVRYFPSGTIHIVVVDPGVGTQRRLLLLEGMNQCFLAPDNGILSDILAEMKEGYEIREIKQSNYFLDQVSTTFHGRDCFAPVAAHLSLRLPTAKLGPPIDDVHRLAISNAVYQSGRILAEVRYIDQFGNVITNITRSEFQRWLGDRAVPIHYADETFKMLSKNYASSPQGTAILLFNSMNYLELAINQGDARDYFNLSIGDPLHLSL